MLPTSKPPDPEETGIDWLAIKKIIVIQVIVLLVMSSAAIAYLNWSSSVAEAEFAGAMKLMMAGPESPDKPSEKSPGAQNQRRPGLAAIR
jgi:hypothetical protein